MAVVQRTSCKGGIRTCHNLGSLNHTQRTLYACCESDSMVYLSKYQILVGARCGYQRVHNGCQMLDRHEWTVSKGWQYTSYSTPLSGCCFTCSALAVLIKVQRITS